MVATRPEISAPVSEVMRTSSGLGLAPPSGACMQMESAERPRLVPGIVTTGPGSWATGPGVTGVSEPQAVRRKSSANRVRRGCIPECCTRSHPGVRGAHFPGRSPQARYEAIQEREGDHAPGPMMVATAGCEDGRAGRAMEAISLRKGGGDEAYTARVRLDDTCSYRCSRRSTRRTRCPHLRSQRAEPARATTLERSVTVSLHSRDQLTLDAEAGRAGKRSPRHGRPHRRQRQSPRWNSPAGRNRRRR